MNKTFRFLLLPWALLATGLIPAFAAPDSDPAYQLAMLEFTRAGNGDSSAVQSALDKFVRLKEKYPGDALILARAGSLVTMQARDAWMPWNKMRFAEQGLDQLDQALAAVEKQGQATTGDGISYTQQVDLVAAITFSQLPKFFNRHGQAERLFRKLVNTQEKLTTPAAFQAQVWLSYGRLAHIQGETQAALERLNRAVAIAPSSVAGIEAGKLIAEGDAS